MSAPFDATNVPDDPAVLRSGPSDGSAGAVIVPIITQTVAKIGVDKDRRLVFEFTPSVAFEVCEVRPQGRQSLQQEESQVPVRLAIPASGFASSR